MELNGNWVEVYTIIAPCLNVRLLAIAPDISTKLIYGSTPPVKTNSVKDTSIPQPRPQHKSPVPSNELMVKDNGPLTVKVQ